MPTAPATFSVPARRWRSCVPPCCWARMCVPCRTYRAPDGPAAGAALGRRPRHRRVVGRAGARPRGDRRLGRVGVHDGLDRGQPRPDRDGLPGRGGARRAAAVARADDDGREIARRPRSCRGSSPRCGSGRGGGRGGPARPGRRRREPGPRCDVGRGRLVGRRGAPARAGPRRRRRLDAPARRRRHATRSSRRAAARSTPPTTRGGSPRSSASRSTS